MSVLTAIEVDVDLDASVTCSRKSCDREATWAVHNLCPERHGADAFCAPCMEATRRTIAVRALCGDTASCMRCGAVVPWPWVEWRPL